MRRKYFVLVLLVLMLALTVTALVACNERKSGIDFIVEGKLYATIDKLDDDSIGVPIDPQKEGYVFRGWYLDNGTWRQEYHPETYINELDSIIKVYAYFITEEDFLQLNEYKISYENVKGENPNPVKYAYGLDHDIILQPLSAEGYEFLGWSTTDNEYVSGIKPGATGDKTYVANWRLKEYDMVFVDNNGETVETIKYTVETDPADIESKLPAVPVKNGYYSEWEEIDCSAAPDDKSKIVNVINTPIEYNITYNIAGDYDVDVPKSNNVATYNIESEIGLNAASKAGYTFLHWLDKNGEIVDTIELGNTGDLEFTAEWEANIYSIEFFEPTDANSKEYNSIKSIFYNVETDIEEFEFPGIKFESGYTARFIYDEKTIFYPPKDGEVSKEIYAEYTPIEYTLSYTRPDRIENIFICNFTIEDTISLESVNPYRKGYKFIGFEDNGQEIAQVSQRTGNVVLDTVWELITYTVTFTSTLTSAYLPDEATYTVEDGIIFDEFKASAIGYTFLGWKENGNPIHSTDDNLRNIRLVASWRENEYTITYFGVDETLNNDNPTSFLYSDTIRLVAPGVKPGYTFDGWYKADADGTIQDDAKITQITGGSYSENLHLCAKFDETQYYITFVDTFTSVDGFPEERPIDVVNSEGDTVYTTERPLTFTISSDIIDVSDYTPTYVSENYEFNGWYYIENGNRVMINTIDPKTDYGNKRLFAHGEKISSDEVGGNK